MKDSNTIDIIFKNKLKDFQEVPPEALWGKIHSNIAQPSGITTGTALQKSLFTNRRFITGISIAASIILTVLLINYFNPKSQTEQIAEKSPKTISYKKGDIANQETAHNTTLNTTKKTEELTQNKEIIVVDNLSPTITPTLKSSKEKDIVQQEKVAIPETEENIIENPEIVFLEEQITPKKVLQSVETNKNIIATNNSYEVKPKIDDNLLLITENIQQPKEPTQKEITIQKEEKISLDEPEQIISENIKEKEEKIAEQKPQTEKIIQEKLDNPSPVEPQTPINRSEYPWSIGGYFSKDFIFNSASSESGTKNSYSFDLAVNYKYHNYSIQTGLGLDYSEDNWDYLIKYKRNEYLGSYECVDSIWFSPYFDTITNSIVMLPNYITSTESVYDSINHSLSKQSKNHYYYLHVPLVLGYKFYEAKKLSMSINGGAMLSILIVKNEPTIGYYDEGIRVTSIDDMKLTRIKTNWQLLLGLNIEYQLVNKLSIAIEPSLKYYVKSIYNTNNINSKNPYSLGLGVGLIYNFVK